MKLALLCDTGCEQFAALEARELVGKEARTARGYVVLDDCSLHDVALLTYRSQSASRILALIAEGEAERPEDVVRDREQLLSFDYAPFRQGSFRVSCERHGNQGWQAREVEEALGALLHKERSFPVDLEEPSMDLWVKITGSAFVIGVDMSGRDLGKREYKAFHTRKSLRAPIAYCAVRAAGFTGEERLVDPFSSDGLLPVEAALFATKTPVQKFRKEFSFVTMPLAAGTDWDAFFARLDAEASSEKTSIVGFAPQVRTLRFARGNAKLAGVEKQLLLTKCDVGWLDTKFDEGSVAFIVTVPPSSGKNTPLKDVERFQDDLFYQARYVLQPGGVLLLVSDKKAEFLNPAEKHHFALVAEEEVWQGGSKLHFLHFQSR